jgi:hypothetical protein
MEDDMMVGRSEDPHDFTVCRLPLGAYQFATFVQQHDRLAFDPYWKPPIYTVEFQAAMRQQFVIERCKMLIDPERAVKLAKVLHVISDGSEDSYGTLASLMATEEYGQFR